MNTTPSLTKKLVASTLGVGAIVVTQAVLFLSTTGIAAATSTIPTVPQLPDPITTTVQVPLLPDQQHVKGKGDPKPHPRTGWSAPPPVCGVWGPTPQCF